ncbi:MAG: flippase-like domain-containing protein [Caldilineaceae bacterium]|nr:flippase-like domain-containing protein [Caldilineaceae bacterium]
MKAAALRSLPKVSLWLLALLLGWWLLTRLLTTPQAVTDAFRQIWLGVEQVTFLDLTLLTLANLAILMILTSRWWVFLAVQGQRLPFWRLLGYRVAAFAVSYFMPGPHLGGEPLQVYFLTKQHQVPAPVAIAAVTIDKLLDMGMNLLVMLVGLALLIQQQTLLAHFPPSVLYLGLSLALLPFAVIGLILVRRHWLVAGITGHLRRVAPTTVVLQWTRWEQTLQQSETHLLALWQQAHLTLILALFISVLSWIALIGEFWYMTYILGFGLSFAQAMTLLLALRFAILLPMPAGLGALEASLALATLAVGLNPLAGMSMSLLIRLRDVTLGLVGLWLGGFALFQRKRA